MNRIVTLPTWMQEDFKALNDQAAIGWLNDYRQSHWQALNAVGLPTRKHERFKYVDTQFLQEDSFIAAGFTELNVSQLVAKYRLAQEDSILLLSINGVYQASVSEEHRLPEGCVIVSLSEAMQQYPEKVRKSLIATKELTYKNPFASLNAAMLQNGIFIDIPDGADVGLPIQCLSIMTEKENMVQHHACIIHVGKSSRVSLIEETVALSTNQYVETHNTMLTLEDKALVDYYKVQRGSKQASQFAHTHVVQQKDSKLTYTSFTDKCWLSRDDVTVLLHEAGAECYAGGFYNANIPGQQIDNHVDVHHLAPHTKSEMFYKGIMGEKAKAIFNGRLLVNAGAAKVVANQENHHLLLADTAEAYSKPELEIYADDVKCKHGATSGQLDQDAMFYLCSRGIPSNEAKRILLKGFAQEVYQRVAPLVLKKHLLQLSEESE